MSILALIDKIHKTACQILREVDIIKVSNMDFFYFGLETMINNALKKYNQTDIQVIDNSITLSLNIDGLPLFKSTNTSVWPVLGLICNLKPPKPFPIALTVGTSKPSNLK